MSLRALLVTLLFLLGCSLAKADSVEVVLSSEVLSVFDSKTDEQLVKQGNKARVRTKVSLSARGVVEGSLRAWLQERLPKYLEGYFQREDLDSGLVTRFKTITFRLQPESLHCFDDEYSPQYRVCKAQYSLSKSNTVDLSAGNGGEQRMSLQVIAPLDAGFPIKLAQNKSQVYKVGSSTQLRVSKRGFAGLPQP